MKPVTSQYEVRSSREGTKVLDITAEFEKEIISLEQHGNVIEVDSNNLNRLILTLVDVWNVDHEDCTSWG